jgi:hypothetical protein
MWRLGQWSEPILQETGEMEESGRLFFVKFLFAEQQGSCTVLKRSGGRIGDAT